MVHYRGMKIKKQNIILFFSGNLESLFKKYHYNVRCYRDVSANELLQHVETYASKDDSKCFVCFISSHGDFSSIECRGGDVKTKDILKKANTAKLKGQPKCIFIDACRTGMLSYKKR